MKAVEVALAHAASGYPVFAVVPPWKDGGKYKKATFAGSHGHLDATTDPDAIRKMFRGRRCAVAIALPDGIGVLDEDAPGAFASAGIEVPRDAVHVTTPRPGTHDYVRVPAGTRGATGEGWDLKTDGGWVMAPGAVATDGATWAGPIPLPPASSLPLLNGTSFAAIKAHASTFADNLAADKVPEHRRNDVLKDHAWVLGEHLHENEILAALRAINAERCDPPLTDSEVVTIAHHASLRRERSDLWVPKVRFRRHDDDADDAMGGDVLATTGARAMSEVERVEPQPLLLDRYQPNGPTVLFGPGGIGKGRLAAQDAAAMSRVGGVVLVVDYEDHEQEWRNRLDECGAALDRVYRIAPHSQAWHGKMGTIRDHAPLIAEVATAIEATFVILDSAVAALPGIDPSDPRAPQVYFTALQGIALPTLTIAHVNRAEDLRYPFGSVFWHNLARLTWSMSVDGQGRLVLANRKANDRPFVGKFDLAEAPRLKVNGHPVSGYYAMTQLRENVGDQIADVLGGDEVEVAVIRQRLKDEGIDVKRNTVEVALRRGKDAGKFDTDGGTPARWKVAR
jgi:hypothetical protein